MKTPAEDELIKAMVDRFLGWRLPEDFNPDNGISFMPTHETLGGRQQANNPVGTNLFTATQATAMFQYVLGDSYHQAVNRLLEQVEKEVIGQHDEDCLKQIYGEQYGCDCGVDKKRKTLAAIEKRRQV